MQLVINGQTPQGWWRIDDLDAERQGVDFLLHPFAVAPDHDNASLIVGLLNAEAAANRREAQHPEPPQQAPEDWAEKMPPQWTDPKILGRVVDAQSTIARNLVLHGAIGVALTHPDMEADSREILEDMQTNLERMFEANGLPPPPWGWRAIVGGPRCRVCGCTDERACEGGCYWAENNLCNRCMDAEREKQAAPNP